MGVSLARTAHSTGQAPAVRATAYSMTTSRRDLISDGNIVRLSGPVEQVAWTAPLDEVYTAAVAYRSIRTLRLVRLRHSKAPPDEGLNLSAFPPEIWSMFLSFIPQSRNERQRQWPYAKGCECKFDSLGRLLGIPAVLATLREYLRDVHTQQVFRCSDPCAQEYLDKKIASDEHLAKAVKAFQVSMEETAPWDRPACRHCHQLWKKAWAFAMCHRCNREPSHVPSVDDPAMMIVKTIDSFFSELGLQRLRRDAHRTCIVRLPHVCQHDHILTFGPRSQRDHKPFSERAHRRIDRALRSLFVSDDQKSTLRSAPLYSDDRSGTTKHSTA